MRWNGEASGDMGVLRQLMRCARGVLARAAAAARTTCLASHTPYAQAKKNLGKLTLLKCPTVEEEVVA